MASDVTLLAGSATAADWERTADGRAIIEIKNVRLGLPADGADTELITFFDAKQMRKQMTLKDVIASPDEARSLFHGTKLIYVTVPNVSDRKDKLLGKFERSEYKSFGSHFYIGEISAEGCDAPKKLYDQLVGEIASGGKQPDADGWAKFRCANYGGDCASLNAGCAA